MWDDDLPQKKAREMTLGVNLSTFSVEELNEYLSVLAAERERVETMLVHKNASLNAALSVFKT